MKDMQKLTIKNIGAIKHVEFEVNRINVFMGPQSSGKSTISKILCHCQWVEKTCFLNDKQLENYQKQGVFYDSLVEYHKLDGYFHKNASIKYEGEAMTIIYTHSSKKTTIRLNDKMLFSYPKICYIPSERNFVAGVPNFSKYNEGNNVLLYFAYDWSDAKEDIQKLDISNLLSRKVSYENIDDRDYIFDNGSKLLLTNASSGVQSVLPLYQTIIYMLSNLYEKERILSPSKKTAIKDFSNAMIMIGSRIADGENINKFKALSNLLISIFRMLESYDVKAINKLSDLSPEELSHNINNAIIEIDGLFDYHFTQLFIEEPEQNLFPETQQELVYWLLENMQNGKEHAAVITTHSPYILFALNNCMMGGLVKNHITEEEKTNFASHSAWINPKLVSVFELDDGILRSVQDADGIIEDNYLNKAYKKNSEEYLELLNYYEDEE